MHPPSNPQAVAERQNTTHIHGYMAGQHQTYNTIVIEDALNGIGYMG